MKTFVRPFFYGWLLLPAIVAIAQDNPAPAVPPASETPAVAPTPVAPAQTTAQPAAAAVAETAPTPVTPAVEADQPPLRRLDTVTPPTASTPDSPAIAPVKRISNRTRSHGGNDRVGVLNDTHVDVGENISGDAVAVLGDLRVDGEVQGDAVAVLGDSIINGTVHGEVVSVLGDVTLGPKAHVDGKIVSVGGVVHRDPGAYVGGAIVKQNVGKNLHVPVPLQSWWNHGLKLGRPLAFGSSLAWLWIATAIGLAFYALLALLFPDGIRRTGDLLVQRPVAVVLTALLTMIALPVLFVLLLVTVVGIPVALIVLPTCVVLSLLFGKASIYGLVGRRITGDSLHPAGAVLAGAGIFVLIYLVPVVGLSVSLLVSALGFGCSVTALFTSRKKTPPPAPLAPTPSRFAPRPGPVVPPVAAMTSPAEPMNFTAPMAAPTFGFVSSSPAPEPAATSPVPAASLPPPITAPRAEPFTPNASLPRAGFWIRAAALLIDLVLVAAIFGPMGAGPMIFPFLAAYGACMWKTKGTTIGGIVCGLRVVRLDDRPLDWPTAIVRALGCFLSLVVAGLGFVWVVFDDERQSWHDKIAGTVVVHAPKGTSLV